MENVSFPNMLSCAERSIDEVFEILDTFSNKTYVPLLSFPTGQDAITDLIRERFISHLNNLIRNIIALEDQPQLIHG